MSKFWQKKDQAVAVAVNDEPVLERRERQRELRRSSSLSSNNSSVEAPPRARTKPARINPQYSAPSNPSISSPMSPTSDVLEEKREFPSPTARTKGTRGADKTDKGKKFQHPHHDVEAAEPTFEVFPPKKQASWIRRHAFVLGIAIVCIALFLVIGVVLAYHLRPKKHCQISWGCDPNDIGEPKTS